jgi:hypothetical protein
MIIAPEKHVWLRLVTSPRVARIAGFNIYAVAVPKAATFPFCVYKRANIMREPTLAGPSFLPLLSIQIASWATNYDAARELADEVRLALDGQIGTLAGCIIHDMRLVSETDDYLDPAAVGAQLPPAYEVRQLYQIRWSESEV